MDAPTAPLYMDAQHVTSDIQHILKKIKLPVKLTLKATAPL